MEPSDGTVTVRYATRNGTASAGSDYTARSGTLTFEPGQTSKILTIPIANDTSDEPNETVSLTLTSPSNAALGTPSSAILTIIDDDGGPVPSQYTIYIPMVMRP